MYDYQVEPSPFLALTPLLFMLAAWLYLGWTQMKMAQKLGLSQCAWWAFIPVLNLFLLFKMASKPWWWFFLCLVPLVNIVVFAILYIQVAKGLSVSPVWGFLCIIPILNVVALSVMAFAGQPPRYSPPPTRQPRQPQPVA